MAKIRKWRGKEITQEVLQNVAAALGEFGLRAEGHAKKELRKGHGVITGTLRRSIHTAGPAYNWTADQVEPSAGSPERGGGNVNAEIQNQRAVLMLGSGLTYALAVHQGHHSFEGYHYLTNGVDKARGELPAILKRHAL